MEDDRFSSTMQYERVVLGAVVRVVPVLVGLVIALSFGASVVHDPEDLAHGAWNTGGQIFGVYVDFVRVAILPALVLLAISRHVDERRVRLVEVGAKGIVIENTSGVRTTIPRSAIHAHSIASRPRGARVVLELDEGVGVLGVIGDRLTLDVDEHDGARLREALAGLPYFASVSHEPAPLAWLRTTASLLVGASVGHYFYGKIAVAVAALPRPSDYVPLVADAAHGWYWGMIMTCAGALYLATRWLARDRRVSIDDRRLVYERRVGQVRVRFDDIETAERDGDTIRVTQADGRVLEVSAAPPEIDALSVELHTRLAADAPVPPAPASLARGGAPVLDWRRRIERHAQAGTYRNPGLDRERLVACLEAPHATREVRVGAAIALSAMEDDDARRRIRVAAERSRNERLRVVFEHLAEGEADEEELEAVLQTPVSSRRSRR